MIVPGLVSVSFRKLSCREIIDLVVQARLAGIEWGGDIHVPHGDVARATETAKMTRDAGLQVMAYGSYYRVGGAENETVGFDKVLESAVALGAPTIRVWAGNRGSNQADPAFRKKVIDDALRIASLAKQAGVSISLEYHGGTLTDTNESAQQFLKEAAHENLYTFWQPPNNRDDEYCLSGLRAVLNRVTNVHVFHWPRDSVRVPLVEGEFRWRRFLDVLRADGKDHCALLEFVLNDDPSQLLKDADILRRWLAVR